MLSSSVRKITPMVCRRTAPVDRVEFLLLRNHVELVNNRMRASENEISILKSELDSVGKLCKDIERRGTIRVYCHWYAIFACYVAYVFSFGSLGYQD